MRRVLSRGSLLVVGLVLGAVAAQGLSACVGPGVSVSRTFGGLGDLIFGPSESAEFPRFKQAYLARSTGDAAQLAHFEEVFDRLRVDYVHPIDEAALIDAAILGLDALEPADVAPPSDRALIEAALDAMLGELDPHTSYLNATEFGEMKVVTQGEFGGLGIQVTLDRDSGWVKVISPIDDTPAFRAGIESGDLISHLDAFPIKGMTLTDAVRLMRGKPGTRITLTVRRQNRAPFEVAIERDIVQVKPVRWRAEGAVGYIRVSSFSEKVSEGIIQAFSALRQEIGPDRVKGYVLDLRNNPGGLLRQSILLADAFLDDGIVVSVRGRDPDHTRSHAAAYGDMARSRPMVVLVNGGSASAAEIVAAALQDHGRAVVMGSRTFGKGSVQVVTPLALEGAIRMTTQLYYVPSGRTIQALGVQPDIVLEPVPDEATAKADPEAGNEETEEPAPRREADLPHALIVDGAETQKQARATLAASACPPAGEDGEDLVLGCALSYLRLGSESAFLAEVSRRDEAALR